MSVATMETEEGYLIKKAKLAQANDPSAAKAWILAAKTLYPNNFDVQFEAYSLEKSAKNSEEAAKCLSYIILNFNHQPDQLWLEIAQLTSALRTPIVVENATSATIPTTSSPPQAAALTNGNTASTIASPNGTTITSPTTSSSIESPAANSCVDFYVHMFAHLSNNVQHKLLQLMALGGNNPNIQQQPTDQLLLEHGRLLLLLMRRFPSSIPTHAPRLLETLVTGHAAAVAAVAASTVAPSTSSGVSAVANAAVIELRDMLLNETLPLIRDQPPPELPIQLVNRIVSIAFEHHINAIFARNVRTVDATETALSDEHWQRLLDTLALCGRMFGWEMTLTGDNMTEWWEQVVQMTGNCAKQSRGPEDKQVLFAASILFVMALQKYMRTVRPTLTPNKSPAATSTAAAAAHAVDFVLIGGFRAAADPLNRSSAGAVETTGLVTATALPCTPETSACLVTASNCWQLLYSHERLQIEFSQLLRTVPLSEWIARFLVDLAFFFGGAEEARAVLAGDANVCQLERSLRSLSLVAAVQPCTNYPALFESLLTTLADLPASLPIGEWATKLIATTSTTTADAGKPATPHMLLLPLSRRAIVQYCAKILVRELSHRMLNDPARCSDSLLGNLLVLIQIDWPLDYQLAEQVFVIIAARGSFTYVPFVEYIICADMIEQFMSLWYPHGGDVNLVLAPERSSAVATGATSAATAAAAAAAASRRIGTRGAEQGQRDDFKQTMRQQIARCNDAVDVCVERFMVGEQMQLMQNLYEK